jgi:hypothetical protein
MSYVTGIRPTVYGGRRPSELTVRPPLGRNLDLYAADDAARLRRLFRPDQERVP